MNQFLLATALILVPVAGFTAYQLANGGTADATTAAASAPVAAPNPLGDMTAFRTITSDVQAIVATGDLVAARTRIADLETAWDDAEPTLRPLSALDWGNVDAAIDAVLTALRSRTPDGATITTALTGLQATLDNPSGAAAPAGIAGVTYVAGIAVTDANGHAIPCEDLITEVRAAVASGRIPAANAAAVADFQARATDRCNADDDTRADAFSAQALALATP